MLCPARCAGTSRSSTSRTKASNVGPGAEAVGGGALGQDGPSRPTDGLGELRPGNGSGKGSFVWLYVWVFLGMCGFE
jgi:hypothetical protein